MSLPSAHRLFQAMDRTWSPKATHRLGPWIIREDPAGGQRVSAATALKDVAPKDIAEAEAAMAELHQSRLFMLTDREAALDQALAERGYDIVDPVLLFAADLNDMTLPESRPLDAIPCDLPLALQTGLWAENGFGPGRLDVMARTPGPKTYLFGRCQDRPAGAAFVAIDETIAMIHALCVTTEMRRCGVARRMLARTVLWAVENGAKSLALATTRENLPAQELFAGLNMKPVGHYHYRRKLETT